MRNNYSLKKGLLTLVAASGTFIGLHAQVAITSATRPVTKQTANTAGGQGGQTGTYFHTCPSSHLTQQYAAENGLQGVYQQALIERQNTPTEVPAGRVVRTVPVVFHVVYNTTAENIPDLYIQNMLTRLNQDFRKNNALIAGIRPAFAGVATDAQIEFCLATKDPTGATTTGITRTQTTMTYFDPDATNPSGNVGGQNSMKTAQYGKAPWDRTKYVNIWICDITNGANFGTAGYAYLATTTQLPPANIDGIVLDYNIGVQQGNSRAVSHEMGHYFGLEHTFGNTTGVCNVNNDDGFTDTPRIKDAFQNQYPGGCASATTAQSCTAGTLWQYENLMDYSNCFCMFSAQQANYMNSVLSGSRNSLNTSYVTNCAQAAPQVPVADFTGCSSTVPQNSTVTFTDASTNAPTSWQWAITPATGWTYVGGTSATSQNPQVQFTAQGTYSVALTATNGAGSNTKTSGTCITVVAPAPCNNLATPLVMGFETGESLTGWTVENTNNDLNGDGDPNTWGGFVAQTGLTAHGGTQMIGYLYNEDGVTSANDWFYTPCLALQPGVTYSLSFWHKVGADQGITYPEKLRVKLGNTNLSTAMTQTIVDLGTLTNTGWVQSTSTFTVTTAGNYHVGFQCYSTANQFFLMVDDINISAQTPAPPVANFTGCGNYTAGNTVTFNNTSTGSPTGYSWSITPNTGWSYTGGTSATSQNPQVTFTTAGTYTVALTATNAGGGNTKTSTGCVVVAPAGTAPTANFTGCGNYNTGSTVTFNNTSTGVPTSYSWSITPGTGWSYTGGTNATSQNPQVTFTAAGTYTVALTATNALGSNTKTSTGCVVVTQAGNAPVASFTGCGNYTAGNTVTFNNTSSNSPTSYSWSITPNTGWSFAGGTNATSQNPQVTFNTAGSYTVALTATNAIGSNTYTGNNCVVVAPAGSAPVANFAGCGSYTTGNTVTFTDASTNSPTAYSWSITPNTGWSFAGGTTSTSQNPQITFNTAGNYTVALTASNAFGSNTKTSAACVAVTQGGGNAPVAGFGGCGNYNTGVTVTLNNTSTNAPTGYSWNITPASGWSYVGGTSATSANPQLIFTVAGNYTVSLTASNGSGSNTANSPNCLVVTQAGQAPTASFQGCPTNSVAPGTTITFLNMSTGTGNTYQWDILPNIGWAFTGGSTATSVNPQVTFTGVASYFVTLTATNGVGNSSAGEPGCVVVAQNAGIANNNLAAGVVLYPNPTTGVTTLSIGNAAQYGNLRVTVYNAVGQALYSISENVPSEVSLNLSGYSQGIYFVEVRSNEGVTTKRLIIGK